MCLGVFKNILSFSDLLEGFIEISKVDFIIENNICWLDIVFKLRMSVIMEFKSREF